MLIIYILTPFIQINPLDYLKSVRFAISHFIHYNNFSSFVGWCDGCFFVCLPYFWYFFERYFWNEIENSPVKMMCYCCCCCHRSRQANFYFLVEVDFATHKRWAPLSLSPRIMPQYIWKCHVGKIYLWLKTHARTLQNERKIRCYSE